MFSFQPKECITVTVELMSFTQGPFVREFWIKTVPPHVVKVTANFIIPQLKIAYPDCIGNITVLQFRRAYHSFERVQNVLIKNESSVATMFYVGNCVNNLMANKTAFGPDVWSNVGIRFRRTRGSGGCGSIGFSR